MFDGNLFYLPVELDSTHMAIRDGSEGLVVLFAWEIENNSPESPI